LCRSPVVHLVEMHQYRQTDRGRQPEVWLSPCNNGRRCERPGTLASLRAGPFLSD
jgi:hypothetical protein